MLSYTEDKTNVPLHKTDTSLLSEDCPGYGSSDCKKQTSPISTLQYKKYSNFTAKKGKRFTEIRQDCKFSDTNNAFICQKPVLSCCISPLKLYKPFIFYVIIEIKLYILSLRCYNLKSNIGDYRAWKKLCGINPQTVFIKKQFVSVRLLWILSVNDLRNASVFK